MAGRCFNKKGILLVVVAAVVSLAILLAVLLSKKSESERQDTETGKFSTHTPANWGISDWHPLERCVVVSQNKRNAPTKKFITTSNAMKNLRLFRTHLELCPPRCRESGMYCNAQWLPGPHAAKSDFQCFVVLALSLYRRH